MGTILGYSSASMGEAMMFNFYQVFFMFFLTNIAGVNPALAGTVTLIAVIFSAIADPAMGYISDNTASKNGGGRRRKYILGGTIPMAILLVFLFTVFDLSPTMKVVYFAVVAIIFWLFYAIVQVPYTAFGAELSPDYNERTKLRSFTTIFNLIGNLIGMSAPMLVVGYFMAGGSTPPSAWQKLAMIIAVLSAVSILVTWATTKGKELVITEAPKRINPLREYWDVLKLKPVKYVLLVTIVFLIAYTMINSTMVYFMIYVMKIDQAAMPMVFTIYLAAGFVFTPILGFLASKIGKRTTIIGALVLSGLGMLLVKFIGIDSLNMLIVYMVIFGIGAGAFWVLMVAVIYDIVEVDEYVNGKRREGSLMALGSFTQKLGGAVAAQIVGLILYLSKYNPMAPEQLPSAISGIESTFIVYPAILLFVTAIVMALFPITKDKHGLLLKALEAKRQGETPSTEGLGKII